MSTRNVQSNRSVAASPALVPLSSCADELGGLESATATAAGCVESAMNPELAARSLRPAGGGVDGLAMAHCGLSLDRRQRNGACGVLPSRSCRSHQPSALVISILTADSTLCERTGVHRFGNSQFTHSPFFLPVVSVSQLACRVPHSHSGTPRLTCTGWIICRYVVTDATNHAPHLE